MAVEKSKTNDNLETNNEEQVDVKIPNDITLEAMRDVETGDNYEDITLMRCVKVKPTDEKYELILY